MYVIISIKKTYNSRGMSLLVCTDLSVKAAHRKVGMDSMVTSGILGGVMVSTLSQIARDVGSISALGTLFPIFNTLTKIV